MVEFYYWREGSGGKSRLECVVLFLPDVWSAQPSRIEWTTIQEQYKAAAEAAMRKLDGEEAAASSDSVQNGASTAAEVDASNAPADKSQIVCSQFCLVMIPASCASYYTEDLHVHADEMTSYHQFCPGISSIGIPNKQFLYIFRP